MWLDPAARERRAVLVGLEGVDHVKRGADDPSRFFRTSTVRSLSAFDSAPPDDESAPGIPDRSNYRLYCDESGIHGSKYLGFGALIMQHERRGDFTGVVNTLRQRHDFWHEIKWAKTSSRSAPFYEDVIRAFFERNRLLFNCLIVERAYVDMKRHEDFDQVKRKFFALFLTGRLKRLHAGATDKAYHVIVDPLPSRYAKAGEAAQKIVNHTLKRDIGCELITRLVTRDSKSSAGIQVADLLLGATVAAWNREIVSPAKLRVMRHLAGYLNWPDMFSDTWPHEVKFNVWSFLDPRDGRRIRTRDVGLRIPCRAYVRRGRK